MTARSDCAYFRRSSLLWMVLISLSMGFFALTVFWPQHVPYQQLGPIGPFVRYLVQNHHPWLYFGFWTSWAIHVMEAVYTIRLCSVKGITDTRARSLWIVQSFLFGIASVSLLLAFKPGQQQKKKS
ncbi:transmembrane protein 254 [Ambystoma mexicanum]|uniref:transmembrane protein 254 n=1 Tax=Ambystoma mexicanum TaxID=8296 RepID=UPI0037E7F7C6